MTCFRHHSQTGRAIRSAVGILLMSVIAVFVAVPFVWMLSSSLKYNREIFTYPIQWIPNPMRWDNYLEVWNRIPFLTYYKNTIKLSVINTAGQLFTCSMAAYSFSRLRYSGRDQLFLAYLATMMVPWHAIMIPQFIIIKNLGAYGTHWALILLYLFNPFGVFLLRQFMMGIPMELSEAARIDGCSEFAIYSRVILPLCKPGLATLMVLTFTRVWNDYMGPLIYLEQDSVRTIQLGLASFRTQYSMEYGLVMAGTVCSLIPIVLIYIFAQEFIVDGVAFSGLKG